MRNRVKNLIDKIFVKAANENNLVVISDPNFGDDIKFYCSFFNKIKGISNSTNEDIPVMNIPDYDLFIDAMTEYITEALQFYRNDYLGLNQRSLAEKLIYDVIGCATTADFANIIPFLKHRTNMLKNKFSRGIFEIGQFKEYSVLGSIESAGSNYEAPYKFVIAFDDESKGRFKPPSIIFGVEGDKVYVYAIQNTALRDKKDVKKEHLKPKDREQFLKNKITEKNLNRFFRKLNANVDENDFISNISPNFLVSFTIFASYMRQLGKKEIVAPIYLPVRYNSNLSKSLEGLDDVESIQNMGEQHEHNYFNCINKFAYLFYRYNHHFPDCIAEFDENNSRIVTKLEKSHPIDKNIIYEIDGFVQVQSQKEM